MNETNRMNCEKARPLLGGFIDDGLDPSTTTSVDRHVEGCPACAAEVAELENLWSLMADLREEPGVDMRARFEAMLAGHEAATAASGDPARPSLTSRLLAFWPRTPLLQMGLAAAALAAGVWLGPRITPGTSPVANGAAGAILQLRSEMESLNRDLALILMEDRSASQRLRAVSLSADSGADTEISGALLRVMREDSSVNVRLAALDVLARLVDRPAIRRGLRETLLLQESPTMQVALADLLLEVDAPASRGVIREVLQQPGLAPDVRDHLTTSLEKGDNT